MNCEQANQIDLVDYLHILGFNPQKISREDYWYLSPLRDEKHASFKVHKRKNVWYDHGLGKGGKIVDFTMEFYRCNLYEALQRIVSFQGQHTFQSNVARPTIHLQENSLSNDGSDARELSIKIIAAKQPIQDLMLCSYLKQRRIDKNVADKYCHEVAFQNGDIDKIYKAIGFKNSAGGYELRNEYFKGSSSPKYVNYIDNESAAINVFEGFFDFMSYQTIQKNQEQPLTNFLVLNSLSFFERSLLLMEKNESIHLYLDHDEASRKCNSVALKRSVKYIDESKLYKGHKDLNDWIMNFGKSKKQSHSLRR